MIKKIINAIIPALIASIWIIIHIYKSHGLSTIMTFGFSMILSYIFYMLTNYKKMPDPERVLSLYLFALGIQFLHFIEEFITGFYTRFPTEIFHSIPFTANEFVVSQMILFFLLILGAIAIFKGWKIPMIFAWFLVIMLQFINAIQHPIYAFIVKGYFPGLYTSLPGWILGPVLFKRLWEVRYYYNKKK